MNDAPADDCVVSNSFPPTMITRSSMERCALAGVPAPMLSIQYRMHPSICQPVSLLFYGNRLHSPPGLEVTRSRTGLAQVVGGAAVWINTRGPETALPKAGYMNESEVDVVMKMMPHLVGEKRTVFIITFYNAQKRAMEARMMREHQPQFDGVSVLSVDSVQVSYIMLLAGFQGTVPSVDHSCDVFDLITGL